jgi:recombinational DNA repair protein (RecF pathway)
MKMKICTRCGRLRQPKSFTKGRRGSVCIKCRAEEKRIDKKVTSLYAQSVKELKQLLRKLERLNIELKS